METKESKGKMPCANPKQVPKKELIKIIKDNKTKIEPETLKIKELKIEITKPKQWTKTFKEIKIPKGWRLSKVTELINIHESKHKDFIFGEDGYLDFFCEQLSIDKENGRARRVYRGRNLNLYAGDGSLLGASEGGRVCFVRDL